MHVIYVIHLIIALDSMAKYYVNLVSIKKNRKYTS